MIFARLSLISVLFVAACGAQGPYIPAPAAAGSRTLAPELRATSPDRSCSAELPVAGADRWFATVCPKDLTPDLVASVQRALLVRGYYSGPITAKMDRATRAAVLAYQFPRGLPSDVLSVRAAQELGLIVWLD